MAFIDLLVEHFSSIILGGVVIGLTYIFRGILGEALLHLAKFYLDLDSTKEAAVFKTLGIEANKHHGKEVDPDSIPQNPSIKEAVELQTVKYNEILELVTASHQTVAKLMTEFVEFKTAVNKNMGNTKQILKIMDDKIVFIEKELDIQ